MVSRRALVAVMAAASIAGGCGLLWGIKDDVTVGGADAGGEPRCPSHANSPAMKAVPDGRGTGSLCVDTTEVTIAQFETFVEAAGGNGATAPLAPFLDVSDSRCDPTIGFSWTAAKRSEYASGLADPSAAPVVWVRYCEAKAFCRYAGKRLCGSRGGLEDFADAAVDEWTNACTGGGANAFGYGPSFVVGKCNDAQKAATTCGLAPVLCAPTAVGTHPGCTSPVPAYGGVFDMPGSVWEWTDVCINSSPNTICLLRGGAYRTTNGTDFAEASCVIALHNSPSHGAGSQASDSESDIGFRCCADPRGSE